ncbi:MAG: DUF3943 domain-containing protein [Spirochaetaceae bacterium]|jgi:hypothetical protein|nr:DUF3943 domain-containing protein [Spirochaetaceae bacterium]
MCTKKSFAFLLLLRVGLSLGAQTVGEPHELSAIAGGQHRNIVFDTALAVGEVTVSNVFMNLATRYVGHAPFADVTFESIEMNFQRASWGWEKWDRFQVNQIGHPYQGSTYFAAGRANGFSFYPSILFAVLGSYTWEVFFESQSPSTNDVVVTTIGGTVMGEMAHRLFLEINSRRSVTRTVGSTLVSPTDRVHQVITRAKRPGRSNIHSAVVYLGVNGAHARFHEAGKEVDSWDGAALHMGADIVYGNPFDQRSFIPYEQFELSARFSFGSPLNYEAAILSDGYLLSFSPLVGDVSRGSTGLSFNFDFFNTTNDLMDNRGHGNINFAAYGLDWTFKYRRYLWGDVTLEAKAHAGWTALGFANYIAIAGEDTGDYGMGWNAKLFLTLVHPRWGKLAAQTQVYRMESIPTIAPRALGTTSFYAYDVSLSHPLTKRFSLGAGYWEFILTGEYDGKAPDMNRRIRNYRVYGAWKL